MMRSLQEIELERWHAKELAAERREAERGAKPQHTEAAMRAQAFLTYQAVGQDLPALAYAVEQVLHGGTPEYYGGERPVRKTRDIKDLVENTINRILKQHGLITGTDVSLLKVQS